MWEKGEGKRRRPRDRILAGIALIVIGLPLSTITILAWVSCNDLMVPRSCPNLIGAVIGLLLLVLGIAFVIQSYRLGH